jgi:hypothetical protein
MSRTRMQVVAAVVGAGEAAVPGNSRYKTVTSFA